MFLTADELSTLTGRRRRKDQLAWLRAHGYKHTVNARGEIIVARGHVEYRLGAGTPPAPEPDFSVFHKTA